MNTKNVVLTTTAALILETGSLEPGNYEGFASISCRSFNGLGGQPQFNFAVGTAEVDHAAVAILGGEGPYGEDGLNGPGVAEAILWQPSPPSPAAPWEAASLWKVSFRVNTAGTVGFQGALPSPNGDAVEATTLLLLNRIEPV